MGGFRFHVGNRGGVKVVVFDDGGFRPASDAEVEMWDALGALRAENEQLRLERDGWRAEFDLVALALKCLPSMFIGRNEHVETKAKALIAENEDLRVLHDQDDRALREWIAAHDTGEACARCAENSVRAAQLRGVHGALLDADCTVGQIGRCETELVRELAARVEVLQGAWNTADAERMRLREAITQHVDDICGVQEVVDPFELLERAACHHHELRIELTNEVERLRGVLEAITHVCDDEIEARWPLSMRCGKSEETAARGSRIYSLLVVPRNMARDALRAAGGEGA